MSTLSKDNYEVLETIGTGSFGTVQRIRRKDTGVVLVWKEICFGKMSEREKTQLVAEVNILREIRNPFVVKYFDRIIDKSTSRLYIVMEHCGGGDLARVIKKCKATRVNLDEPLIWKVLAQCLLALRECHRHMENGELRPIMHRDIKPANILLDLQQNIKVGDFGLAKELNSQSGLAQTNVGTPFYMAPEIINEKAYDERSDIWSLGCLCYELCALRPPFDATNAVSLAVKINTGKFARIPNKYSDGLFDVICFMLRVDPKRRPRVEDLEGLPALQPAMTAARALAAEHAQRESRDKERKAAAAAAAAAGAAGAGAGGAGVEQRAAAVAAREAAVSVREASASAREGQLDARDAGLTRREGECRAEERRLAAWAEQLKEAARGSASISSVSGVGTSSSSSSSIASSGAFVIHADPDPAAEAAPFSAAAVVAGGAGGREAYKDDVTSGVRRAKELLGRPLVGAGAVGGAVRAAPVQPTAAAPAPSRGPVRTGAECQKENLSTNVFAFAARGVPPGKDKERHPLAGHNYLAPHPSAAGNAAAAGSPFKRQRVGAPPAVASFRPAKPSSAPVHHVNLQTLLQNRVAER